jgi:hypothetical protein
MKFSKKVGLVWMIIMFVITFTCSLAYLVAQQSLRLGANEIPAQLAMDTALKLQSGKNVATIMPAEKVDISKSLTPFVMVFDDQKKLLSSSGIMDGHDPSYPLGVLDHVAKAGEERVTWQPQTGLRFATVALKYDKGYIVAARSLAETENLIDEIGKLVLLAWAAFLVFSLIGIAILNIFIKSVFKKETL